MKVYLITIGSEILLGHTVNSNFAYLAEKLAEEGFAISREVCIPDDREEMRRTFEEGMAEADVVISIGGLGPTKDDCTRQVAAEVLGADLEHDEDTYRSICEYLRKRHVKLPDEAARTQALVPRGAQIMQNANGTAPGLWCTSDDKTVILLPGPPRELKGLVNNEVMSRLKEFYKPEFYRRQLSICGIPESLVADKVEEVAGDTADEIEIAYCARPSQVDVRLSAPVEGREAVDKVAVSVADKFGNAVLEEGVDDVVESIATRLSEKGWSLALAESCTGGQISSRITEISGASRFLAGSIICYTNEWKQQYLGVKEETIRQYGAVSRETAGEMLAGIKERTGVEAAIAVTGIAGPSGGTPEKPVGLVYIASSAGEIEEVTEHHFPGSRENVRNRTTAAALNKLREQLLN